MRVGAFVLLVVCACGRIGFDPLGADQPPSCMNAIRDTDEQGVDCGGTCLLCPGAACSIDVECASGYCVGGFCELATAPPFWLPGPDLSTVRQGARAATGSAGEVYVIGGRDNSGLVATVDILAPGAAAFAPGPTMINGRENHAVANIAGTIYAFGSGAVPDALEALVGTWQPRASAPVGHGWIDGVAGPDGNFYVSDIYDLSVYTPGTDSWSVVPGPMDGRDQIGVARGTDGLIYVIAGRTDQTGSVFVDAYEVPTNVWSRRAPLPEARVYASAVAAPDGRIYAIGGGVAGGATTARVVAYTPERDRWAEVARLGSEREQGGAALDAKGRIYMCGGMNQTARLSSTESYGPDMTLSAAQASPGATVTVSHENFAADAAVLITIDGVQVASGVTSFDGTATTSFVVPPLAAGPHEVRAIDNRSQYPITVVLDVQ